MYILYYVKATHKTKRIKVKAELKPSTRYLSLSYGASPAIWDHTVFPVTRYK